MGEDEADFSGCGGGTFQQHRGKLHASVGARTKELAAGVATKISASVDFYATEARFLQIIWEIGPAAPVSRRGRTSSSTPRDRNHDQSSENRCQQTKCGQKYGATDGRGQDQGQVQRRYPRPDRRHGGLTA